MGCIKWHQDFNYYHTHQRIFSQSIRSVWDVFCKRSAAWVHICSSLVFIKCCYPALKPKQCGWFTILWTKAFCVCASEVLPHCAGVPESTRGFELSGQRHHSSEPSTAAHSCCSSPRTPLAFVLLIVLRVFKGLPRTIGHLEAFKWSTGLSHFLFLHSTLGLRNAL